VWFSGPNPTHVKHFNGTYHHTYVFPCWRTTCWIKKTARCAAAILEVFTYQSVENPKCESGYAKKSGMGRKP
jgi:hypothetical protein